MFLSICTLIYLHVHHRHQRNYNQYLPTLKEWYEHLPWLIYNYLSNEFNSFSLRKHYSISILACGSNHKSIFHWHLYLMSCSCLVQIKFGPCLLYFYAYKSSCWLIWLLTLYISSFSYHLLYLKLRNKSNNLHSFKDEIYLFPKSKVNMNSTLQTCEINIAWQRKLMSRVAGGVACLIVL